MYNQTGFSKTYLPKRQQASVYPTLNETNNSDLAESVYLDNLSDLKRWVQNSKEEMKTYVSKNVLLTYERNFKDDNEAYIQKIKSEISDTRGFLIDMRKGIDWYKSEYDNHPQFLESFYAELRKDYSRFTKLKSYLSKRLRKYGALNSTYNQDISVENTRFMKLYIDFRIKAIDIFLSQNERFTVRKNLNLGETDED